jgi:hypothetical protein
MVVNLLTAHVPLISDAQPVDHLDMKEAFHNAPVCLHQLAQTALWARFLNLIMKKVQLSPKEML